MLTEIAPRLVRAVDELDRLAAIVDASRSVPATPGWSVADVFAHLAIESDRYARELEGAGEWSSSGAAIAETNRRELASFHERRPAVLVAQIRHNVDRYVTALAERDPDAPTHGFDGGLVIAPRHAAGVLLGELVVHAHDVAAASAVEHEIDPGDAARIAAGAWQVTPAFLRQDRAADADGAVEVRLRGHGRLSVRVAGGVATIDDRSVRPDAIISVDPVAFLLVMYGRSPQWRAVLRGQVVAWGRRPHRALLLKQLFDTP